MFMSLCNNLQFVFPPKSQQIDHMAHHFLKKWNAHIGNEMAINGYRQGDGQYYQTEVGSYL